MATETKPELGKWGCWRFFAADPGIRPYLPPTTPLTLNSLRDYLSKYAAVYIKPSAGYGGRGIIKAWRTANGFAFVHERGQQIQAATVAELFRKVRALARPGILYLVQKGIDLPKIQGRPLDIRLMMMRHSGQWEYVGMLAKVAGQQSIITNIARGKGYVLDIDRALSHSLGMNAAQIAAVKREMIEVAYKTVRRFDAYKRYWQIGLDMAVDTQGKVWIIEENTGPAHSLFSKLPDQTMYRKIKDITAKIRSRRTVVQKQKQPMQKQLLQKQPLQKPPASTTNTKTLRSKTIAPVKRSPRTLKNTVNQTPATPLERLHLWRQTRKLFIARSQA